ncbi:MAG: VanZ family protein [Sedimentibacter sp.]
MIRKNNIISWIPAVIWMIVIFTLSAQPAVSSNNLSKSVTKIIVEIIGKIVPLQVEMSTVNDLVSQFNHFVRKFAHFFAYMILELLIVNALVKSGIKGSKVFMFSITICFIYASSDEIHQLFVPGRGCQFKDVMIDIVGALAGILLYRIILYIKSCLCGK